jgi:hypothetical protein
MTETNNNQKNDYKLSIIINDHRWSSVIINYISSMIINDHQI